MNARTKRIEVDTADWMSTAEAAKHIGVSARTLYRLIDEGGLQAYRLGRVIRLKRAGIDAFIEDCRIKPGDLSHLYPERVEEA